MWRCLNDVFGYCYDEPHRAEHIERQVYISLSGRAAAYDLQVVTCKNDYRTCSQHRTLTQLLELKKNIVPLQASD